MSEEGDEVLGSTLARIRSNRANAEEGLFTVGERCGV